MTNSWKNDEITSAVQMMDTAHVPYITRDDSEEQEHSLHNQQVRRPTSQWTLTLISSSVRRRMRIRVHSPKRQLHAGTDSDE